MKRRKKRLKINPIFIISLIIILALGYSFAKYIIEDRSIHIQSAQQFYFNSDVLKEENTEYILKDWDGKSEYKLKINLKNYEDNLRNTNEDIIYEFQTSCNNPDIAITTSIDNKTKSLTGKTNSEEIINININPKKIFTKEDYVEIDVSAIAQIPYEKTISAKFKIYVQDIINYKTNLIDSIGSEYATLNIETYNNNQRLTISYDNAKTILDMNNEIFKETTITQQGNKNNILITLNSNSIYNLTFIKNDFNNKLLLGTDIIVEN